MSDNGIGPTCPSVARTDQGHVHVCELPADHIQYPDINGYHVCGDCGVSW